MDLKRKFSIVLPLLLYGILYIFVFAVLEGIDHEQYFMPYFKIDHMIPFIPAFVVPYILWFAWIPLACIILLLYDEDMFIRTRRLLIIGMTAFLIISAVFPTKLDLRPDTLPDSGIFCQLLNVIYSADTSTNVFPSIHVYNTCAIWHAVYASNNGILGKRWFNIGTTILSVLIILSTMFIKQHSIIDVAGGIIMFVLVYYIILIFFEKGLDSRSVKAPADEA